MDAGLVSLRRRVLEDGAEAPRRVRPVIASSWHRSRMCGLAPTEVFPEFREPAMAPGRLATTTDGVVRDLGAALDQSITSLQLTDMQGVILRRWAPDAGFARRLSSIGVDPGFSWNESSTGTNSAGIVIETGLPAKVLGAEHYAEQFTEMACFGHPVFTLGQRRLVATLNLTCRLMDVNAFQEPWLASVAHEVERRLWANSHGRSRRLFEEFHWARDDGQTAVVAVSPDMVIGMPKALRRLAASDHALLWDLARNPNELDHRREVTLAEGVVEVQGRPVMDGDACAGALLRIRDVRPVEVQGHPEPSDSLPGGRHPLDGLAGRSPAWQEVRRLVTCAQRDARSCVIAGEPGTGKSTIARLLAGSGSVDHDCALGSAAAWDEWLAQLGASLDGRHAVVLHHVDALPEPVAAAVRSLLAGRPGVRVTATYTGDSSLPLLDHPLVEFFSMTIPLPAVRDRLEDLPDLLAHLTAWTMGHPRPIWTPAAIQVLSRLPWHRNVAGLAHLVQDACLPHPGRTRIDVTDLPAAVRAGAPRRRLYGLEFAEAMAISQALENARGNKVAAAEALGIARSTLYRRIRELGIDLERSSY